MTLGFGGEAARHYAEHRRGYPPEAVREIAAAFELTGRDIVLDLGCGTGQLTLPLAAVAGFVVGVDPEPDMLRYARDAAARDGVSNATWVLGADTDVPALRGLLGGGRLAAAVAGQALHWMDHDELFRVLRPLLRPGGGVAVLANGAPAWLHDSDWSRALRGFLEQYFDTELKDTCGTAEADRRRYAAALPAAGFTDVRTREIRYDAEVSFDGLLGGVLSAVPERLIPPPRERRQFAARLRRALPEQDVFTEHVCVSVLTARSPVPEERPQRSA